MQHHHDHLTEPARVTFGRDIWYDKSFPVKSGSWLIFGLVFGKHLWLENTWMPAQPIWHIAKRAHSKKNTFQKGHIPKRAHSILISSQKEHIPKRTYSILITFQKEQIPFWLHSKKRTFQKEWIPKGAYFKTAQLF